VAFTPVATRAATETILPASRTFWVSFVQLLDIFGQDRSATFSIDTARLSHASLDSTMQTATCEGTECDPLGTVTVTVRWTGIGELSKDKLTAQSEHLACAHFLDIDVAASRESVFAGTIDGASPGTPVPEFVSPDLQVVRHGSFYIRRDCF